MWSEVVYLHSENSCFSTTKMETIPEKTKKKRGESPLNYFSVQISSFYIWVI